MSPSVIALERVWLIHALKKWQLLIKHQQCLCIFQRESQTPSFIFASDCCQPCSSTSFQSHKSIWVSSQHFHLRPVTGIVSAQYLEFCSVLSEAAGFHSPVWFASPLVRRRYGLQFPSASSPPSGFRRSIKGRNIFLRTSFNSASVRLGPQFSVAQKAPCQEMCAYVLNHFSHVLLFATP